MAALAGDGEADDDEEKEVHGGSSRGLALNKERYSSNCEESFDRLSSLWF